MNDIKEQKRILRGTLRQRRAAMPAALRRAASDRIRDRLLRLPEIESAGSVFCFMSSGEEANTHALIDALIERGKRVLIPWIPPGGEMLAADFPGWAELVPGPMGILAPVSPRPFDGPVEVCITPGLGFTLRGERIGYGRGYYDRWLARHAACTRIGIAFECQLVDWIPITGTDAMLPKLVTEDRIIDTGAARGG